MSLYTTTHTLTSTARHSLGLTDVYGSYKLDLLSLSVRNSVALLCFFLQSAVTVRDCNG